MYYIARGYKPRYSHTPVCFTDSIFWHQAISTCLTCSSPQRTPHMCQFPHVLFWLPYLDSSISSVYRTRQTCNRLSSNYYLAPFQKQTLCKSQLLSPCTTSESIVSFINRCRLWMLLCSCFDLNFPLVRWSVVRDGWRKRLTRYSRGGGIWMWWRGCWSRGILSGK